jgi:hypothetical protein
VAIVAFSRHEAMRRLPHSHTDAKPTRMGNRRCGTCEGLLVPYEIHRLAGFALVYRYRCPGCATKFDVMTTFGQCVLGGITVALPLVVSMLPERKFAKPSDRGNILVFLLIQLAVVAVVLARDRVTNRRHRGT